MVVNYLLDLQKLAQSKKVLELKKIFEPNTLNNQWFALRIQRVVK